MFTYLYVCAIFFPIIVLYCSVVSFFDKCKAKLTSCYTHMGDFSLAHFALERTCAKLEEIKAIAKYNAIVGRNGLPCVFGAKRDWGEPFSVYTAPGGRKFHLKYGCCGATHVQHLYSLRTNQLEEEKFCSKCNHNLHPNLLPFLRLYHDCKYYLRKENTACNLLKCQIPKCEKGLMRILYRREVKRIKSEYQKMLSDKENMQNKLCIHLRKGYLGLRGAEFYRVCYAKHPRAGTNPNAPFIAALKPVSKENHADGKTYQILRLGFPGGGYILYENDTFITSGKESKLLGVNKEEKDIHYVYLPVDSVNLLPSGE